MDDLESQGESISIWERLGFTASSNNAARQKLKIEAAAKAKADPEGARTK